jgi:Protein of unknown function (DUF1592)/Protein of unknown function (DUF1588)/Protein of unknown function (DUF1587)/Protein of unknown function (DUF1595)/Protein of unknown function (DUF1585)/Planctomycete cytochrome C
MRLALGLALAGALFAAESKTSDFLTTYCTGCHGPAVQMADRRFDRLQLPPSNPADVSLLRAIADKLKAGSMPPASARQPAAAEKQKFLASFANAIASAAADRHPGLRRLNRREYLNTIGDLLGINMLMFDPTSRFPRDQTAGHMDNVGDALVTSGYLLEQYMDAADQAVEKAFRLHERPQLQTWVFNSNFRQQPELDYAHIAVFGQKFMALYSTAKTVNEEGAYGPLYAFAQGVPADGYYDIEVQAEAVNRKNPYDARLFAMDPDAPFRMGVVPGNAKVGALHHAQPVEPPLGEVTVADNVREWYRFHVWLDAGYTPRFTFPNGMNDSRRAFTIILNRYRNLLPPDQRNFTPGIRPARPHVLRYGFMPQIRIYEVRITGPIVDRWPPASQRLLLGGEGFEPGRTREILERFAGRAYRRPATRSEVDALMAVAGRRQKDGKSPFEALKDAFKAALCSPAFLYLEESGPFALASRLSYFLWSTMPDAELMEAASSGELQKPAVLLAQTRRMLADPRSDAFVNGFLDSWLNLRSLGDMPPDRDAFAVYYSHDLQTAMRTETRMFTRDLLDRNRSIVNFLDSRYTFVNKNLARLYGMDAGIPSVGGEVFRKVEITDPNRGGLIGQASVLTVSANGVETSPVTRGVWMLENIFGTPPAPPPDNVPALDPDVRGAKSIREILGKHRESAACMTCHTKIDPPGFALENFDPIGAWRSNYKNGVPIDASGELAGAGTFHDVAEFKQLLVAHKDDFARVLAARVLAYACGRRVESLDGRQVESIARQAAARGYGFRDLVELAILSGQFRANR